MDLRLGAFQARVGTPAATTAGALEQHHALGRAKGAAQHVADTPEVKRLRKAAAEFEATLVSNWWSAMKDSGLSGEEDTDPGKDTLDQLGMQALSTAISSGKGLGIGDMLVRSLLKIHPEIGAEIKAYK